MKATYLTALLLTAILPHCLAGQNTGARATPQTQSSAPAAVRSNGAMERRSTSKAPRSGAAAGRGSAGQGGAQHRSTNPVSAANSSVTVLGSGKLDAVGGGAVLPGVNMPHNALGIPAGTPIAVRLQQTIDSGHARNGDTLHGVLTEALGKLPSGSPVTLTVVAAAPAGEIGSSGVLSIQVTGINGEQVLSQVITAEGKEGTKLLPDDAPAKGSEAVFAADASLIVPAA